MKDFVGNANIINYLKKAVNSGELSHAYLFCGPENVGKTKAATYFAKLLLCEGANPTVCGSCPSCKLFESGNHPDFFYLDKETVLVDEIRELVSSLDLKPYRGKGKIALISHAERLTNQALNSFLKTLEEPSNHTTIILTTENRKNLLPTIVSRARAINFGLVPDKQIFEHLNGELGIKKEETLRITALASGRIGFAVSLSENSDKTGEIVGLTEEFNRIYRSQDIYEKISYADKLSKSKDNLPDNLQNIELGARNELLSLPVTEANKSHINNLIKMLDKIAKSREMIASNANARLVLEGLLMGNIS